MKNQSKHLIYLCFVFIFLCFTNYSIAQEKSKDKRNSKFDFLKSESDSSKKHNHFELSFGQNLLFISDSKQIDIHDQAAVVVPTSSVLFFSEFRPQKVIRIPVFINLATESKQFIVDGQIINEKANPTFGAGITFRLVQMKFDDKSKIELETGPLASFIFYDKSKLRMVPVLAARLKICRGENFVMYLGCNYSFGIDAFGILYGTGTVF
jgi:hypothetical protein